MEQILPLGLGQREFGRRAGTRLPLQSGQTIRIIPCDIGAHGRRAEIKERGNQGHRLALSGQLDHAQSAIPANLRGGIQFFCSFFPGFGADMSV